ncbi:hypothetical protein CHS0354_018718 [Potamilus streckersoni]|uniref:Uncharacterized protein n=1 Tax=Potamilus streckersoni TaxID=2493646 RepID=A0AAE0RQW9_9BIVA|nr:hypothetical protein CHS0354_018718 [Potamilus streckersoni]
MTTRSCIELTPSKMLSVENQIFLVDKQGGIHCRERNFHLVNVCDQFVLLTVSTDEGKYIYKNSDATHEFTDEITLNGIETMKVLSVQDMDGDTFLHHVIIMEQETFAIKIIDLLCNSDLLNICNFLFQTPLHLAVLTRQTIIVKRLLEAGARTDIQDHLGNTPLHTACQIGDSEIVSLLMCNVSSRLNTEIRNFDGLKCLHLAAFHNKTEVISILLNGGADINAGDAKSGRTILHWAAECGKGELVDLLLSRKDVDVNSETYEGITAIELAEANGHLEIMRKFSQKL